MGFHDDHSDLMDRPEIFSTAPQSAELDGDGYRAAMGDVARWSEDHGCTGALIYSDNRLVDPWMAAQLLVERSTHLAPLVAIQPAYYHPYAVATMVASFAHLYGRRVCLNLIAGGFRNDLLAMGDHTPHDRRYDRLIEFGTIVRDLVRGEAPVTLDGEFYQVERLTLSPPVPEELQPDILVSGSSPAGRRAARILGGRPISYAKPPQEQEPPEDPDAVLPGLRLGIVARTSSEEAWGVARARCPEDRKGRVRHELARKISDSVWHQDLSEVAEDRGRLGCYWLGPFEHAQTMCPYLVGSYEEVGGALETYQELGYRSYILDIPRGEADLAHARVAFDTVASSEVAA